jgi:hypothetical protein
MQVRRSFLRIPVFADRNAVMFSALTAPIDVSSPVNVKDSDLSALPAICTSPTQMMWSLRI